MFNFSINKVFLFLISFIEEIITTNIMIIMPIDNIIIDDFIGFYIISEEVREGLKVYFEFGDIEGDNIIVDDLIKIGIELEIELVKRLYDLEVIHIYPLVDGIYADIGITVALVDSKKGIEVYFVFIFEEADRDLCFEGGVHIEQRDASGFI